jgi:aspartate carbamoyltransferase regulatory subunit
MYFVCGNKQCVCRKKVPKGKKPQMFNKDGNTMSCPYCGFTQLGDYWETRDMEAAEKETK